MTHDWNKIDYLKNGNKKQQKAYQVLSEHKIMWKLQAFEPILVGTIPIEIDIESSDLDIICYSPDLEELKKTIQEEFGLYAGFRIETLNQKGEESLVANFVVGGFEIEIFGQNIPTKQQNAYLHMIIEHRLLKEKGESFQKKIIELKKEGYKTEPAFGFALGLEGNAYEELLKL